MKEQSVGFIMDMEMQKHTHLNSSDLTRTILGSFPPQHGVSIRIATNDNE